MSNEEQALALAEEWGLPVFPCSPHPNAQGKTKWPHTEHGFRDATRNLEQIAAWWERWPDALVGVPTGRATRLLVIDVDPTGADWQSAHFAALAERGEPRIHKTLRGRHLIYRMPDTDISCRTDVPVDGVDVRANGGYVIWWPAHGHDALGPEIDEIPEVPAWLLDQLKPKANGHDLAPLKGASPEAWRNDRARVVDALVYLDASDYDEWIRAGFALHLASGGSDDGFAVWHAWSSSATNYAGAEDCLKRWASFRHDKTREKTATLGSIFATAKCRGYAYTDEANGAPVLADSHQLAADPLAFMERFKLTDEEADKISDPTWVERGLIVEGHVVAIVAKPNGGKTTVIFHLACSWAEHRTVVYVDADTNPADAKRRRQIAQAHGVHYLTPDLKVGESMRDVVEQLERLAGSDADLTGQVWIFDTLKKMANVIHKESLKHLLGMLRKLSSRGMTCVLLAHTNKYKNAEGEFQYEGTGDLESDVDELIYFEPRENADRSLTVSTRCRKRRAEIAELTWEIDPERNVTQRTDYVDIAEEARRLAQLEKDETAVEVIADCLADGPKKQHEIVKHAAGSRVTAKALRAVLKRYRGKHWLESKLPEKNALEYRLIPKAAPPGQTEKLKN